MKTGYELLLPKGLLDYFDVVFVDESANVLVLHLDEKNIVPEEYAGSKIISKGFFLPCDIDDFPVRGKRFILHVRRRRWLNIDTGTPVMRNWELSMKGTRLTEEFASFLKGTD
jgi:hypothetical protein